VVPGLLDLTPSNNTANLNIDVIDLNDAQGTAVHDWVVCLARQACGVKLLEAHHHNWRR